MSSHGLINTSLIVKTSYKEDQINRDINLTTGLNEADLVMSLSPKDILMPSAIGQQHQLDIHTKLNPNETSALNSVSTAAAAAVAHHHHNLSNIHHLQNIHSQHHSTFLNSNHSTPFSVTDILSPIEESYRKLELNGNPPSPFRTSYYPPLRDTKLPMRKSEIASCNSASKTVSGGGANFRDDPDSVLLRPRKSMRRLKKFH